MRKFINILVLLINVIVGMVTIASAWAGTINPVDHPLAAVVAMLVPLTAPVMVVILVIDLINWRKTAIFAAACLAFSLPGILDTFPINLKSHDVSADEQARSWTLLTYNVINLQDLNGEYPGGINPTVSYILSTDADVVCAQELEYFAPNPTFCITQTQIDSLSARYPYVFLDTSGECIMSKFPVTPFYTSNDDPNNANIAGYAVDIHGHRVAIFNVHLCSIGLSDHDKEIYRDLTDMKRGQSMDTVRTELIDKLEIAAVKRSQQTETLIRLSEKYGGKDCIICGDFNDVPGCWPLRRLDDAGFKEVYPAIGLGYMRTYNRNRFYFRIDHILWRGDMYPRAIQRGDGTYSDHFPLLTTFVFND